MLKMAVCDDNEYICEQVAELSSRFLKKIGVKCERKYYDNGKKLVDAITKDKEAFDIIMLDIDMPELDGMKAAKILRDKNISSHIIFLTGFPEKMKEAFRVKAHRFITKPINDSEFKEALTNAALEIINRQKADIDHEDGKTYTVNVCDIMWVESLRDCTAVHLRDRYYISKKPLKYWLETYDAFIKIHKSHIIAMEHIAVTDNRNNKVTLDNGKVLDISERLMKSFREAKTNYLISNS